MHEKTKQERKRLNDLIFTFCFSEQMRDRGCVNCILNELDVCGEKQGGATVTMESLKKAEKIINEVMR